MYLALLGDLRFRREDDLSSVEDSLILKDSLLRFIVTERFLTEKDFKEDYSNTPNIYFRVYHWRITARHFKTFRGLIPISSNTL